MCCANLKRDVVTDSVNGYVKNVNDDVEAVFEGLDEKVDELIELCKQGPVGSKVENVNVKAEKYKKEFDKFEVR